MKIINCLFLMLFSTITLAGSETGTVVFTFGQWSSSSTSAGYTFFLLESYTKSDEPGCITSNDGERWVIDNDWPAADMQMSILLAAAISGKSVLVRGSGDCGVNGSTETAVDIIIVD